MASDLIDPQTIAAALRKNVESWTPSVDREEVGRVIETGDGVARVAGLPRTMANELLEFPSKLLGVAFNLDEAEIGCIIFGEAANIEEGDPVKQTGRDPVGARRRGVPRPGRRCPRAPDRRQGRHHRGGRPTLELQAPNVVVAPAGEGAALHRHHGDRRDDRDRSRPAPADHRRPPDRQDRRRARHDHQPEAVLGDRAGRALHLRRDRPEGLDGRRGRRDPPRERRARVHRRRQRGGLEPGPVPVRRPVRRRGDRRALDGRGQARR